MDATCGSVDGLDEKVSGSECGAADLGPGGEEEDQEAEAVQMEFLQHRLRLISENKESALGLMSGRLAPLAGLGQQGDAVALDNTTEHKPSGYGLGRGSTVSGTYKCVSNSTLSHVVSPARKGIALDDDTFEGCSNKIPIEWPVTNQTVNSIRLFKPWGLTPPRFFHTNMTIAFNDLKLYAQATNATFLFGISVTCDEESDDFEWEAGKEFLRLVGSQYIMGLAVGNEPDLNLGGETRHPGCRNRLWSQGGFLERFNQRVAEFDNITGMSEKPITVVFSGAHGLGPGNTQFIQSVWERYSTRFVATFNIYPQFSTGLGMAGCDGAASVGTKFTTDDPAGFVPAVVKDYRTRMLNNGWHGMKLWIGETGWATQAGCLLGCYKACNSEETEEAFYRNFLAWDIKAGHENETADHAFFFTVRDSSAFGRHEKFGVIGRCEDTACKF